MLKCKDFFELLLLVTQNIEESKRKKFLLFFIQAGTLKTKGENIIIELRVEGGGILLSNKIFFSCRMSRACNGIKKGLSKFCLTP